MMSNYPTPKKKTRESMSNALAANLPDEPGEVSDVSIGPTPAELLIDSEADYEFARTNLKGLLDKANEAIELMMRLAQGCEHPRAFEVLGNLMRNSSDITDQLMSLQKDRKRLSTESLAAKTTNGSESNLTTNNSLFVGSVTQLQKFLVAQRDAVIEAELICEEDTDYDE